ncbi:MAG TPA: DUF4349 domain-containing protein, partial [Segetibacter sp.]
MKLLIKAMAMLMAVILISCRNQNSSKPLDVQSSDVQLNDLSKSKEEDKTAGLMTADTTTTERIAAGNVLQSGSPSHNIDWERKLIKTAEVTLELDDFKTFNSAIHHDVKRFGAYIASEQQNQSEDKLENVIAIKVPVVQFEDLMNSLPDQGVKVLERRISTEDVSNEVVDTKARIEAKKQARDQYLELIKKAKTVKEIVTVQKEVNSIQEEIEAGSGRVQYLGHEAAYSTVNLTYFQYLTTTPGKDDSPTFIVKLK